MKRAECNKILGWLSPEKPFSGRNEIKLCPSYLNELSCGMIEEKETMEDKEEMSFVGALCTAEGLIAFADTKSTICSQYGMMEEKGREAKKLFPYQGGILLTYGVNEAFDTKKRHFLLEDLLEEFFIGWNGADLKQKLFRFLFEKGTLPEVDQSFCFINLKKERRAYIKETFQIIHSGYRSESYEYLKRNVLCFGGAEAYQMLFQRIDVSRIANGEDGIEGTRQRLKQCLEEAVWFFDGWLEYNPVGGNIVTKLLL